MSQAITITEDSIEARCRRLEAMAAQWERCARNAPGSSYLRISPAETYQRYAGLCREQIAIIRKAAQ